MDGRGGCCIARTYTGGIYDASKIDRIMLRFRPIAPKPAAGGPVSDEKTVLSNACKAGRAKRKYVRDGSKKSCQSGRKKKRNDGCVLDESEVKVVTLPLLPEKPVEKDTPTSRSPSSESEDLTVGSPWRMSSIMNTTTQHDYGVILCGPGERTVVIVVECVTDVCAGAGGGGGEERRMISTLERDTCPGFVSDGWDRVGWTNEAFREMVMMREEGYDQMVWLVVKDRLPVTCQAFTCRVRVLYTWRKERHSVTVPCDVWRINGTGGLAWRLDVKAALSLGR
ncbi:hypothetical protein Syun_024430 [Stephania yunnanensis]|uniref:DUF7950 domain-containing protein n=1 Tax=Stephania yunnanensis TaxID=152371 RepID=A0AAP0I4E5_9MAGN